MTGRAVLAALTRLGRDGDTAATTTRPPAGVSPKPARRPMDSATAARHIADYALVVTSPGFPPTAPVLAAAAARPACRSGATSSWPGGSTRAATTGRRGAGWWSPAPTARPPRRRCCTRCWSPPAGTAVLCGNIGSPVLDVLRSSPPSCWPSSCPASSCTGRRRCDPRPGSCSTSPRTTWTGTPRWTTTPRAKARVLRRPGGGRRARRPGRGGAARGRRRARAGRLPARRARGRGARRARRRAGRQRVFGRPDGGAGAGVIDPGAGSGGRARRAGRRRAGAQHRGARRRDRDGAGLVPGGPAPSRGGGRRRRRSATSTIPRPRTRMPPRRRCWPTRGWCGSPAVCSRAHRCTRPWPGSLRGWSERC